MHTTTKIKIQDIIIRPAVLHACESWPSPTVKTDLKVSTYLTNYSGPKKKHNCLCF